MFQLSPKKELAIVIVTHKIVRLLIVSGWLFFSYLAVRRDLAYGVLSACGKHFLQLFVCLVCAVCLFLMEDNSFYDNKEEIKKRAGADLGKSP